jgi:hypothetical protein
MKRPGTDTSARRSRLLIGGGAGVILAAGTAVVLVFGPTADHGETSGATTSPVELAPAPTTPSPAGPTGDVDQAPPQLPAVDLSEAAQVGNGVTARITRLEAIDGTGKGPGNIAGPALRVTVRITNGTADTLSLDGVAVDMTHGADALPASPLDDPSADPFTGVVQPGASADGVYVFTVPADDRDAITVTVGYQAGAPFMVFTGSAR